MRQIRVVHFNRFDRGDLATMVLVGGVALALALLPFRLALPLLGLGGIATLALIEPVFGLYAAVLSVPIQETVLLPGNLTWTQACVTIALGAWVLRVLARPGYRLRLSGLLAPWAVLLWVLLLSASVTSYDMAEGLKECSRWVVALIIFVLTLNTLSDRRRVWGLIACLLAAPALTAALGLVQFLRADGPAGFVIAGGRFVRAYGTLGTPNAFAGYLNMAWPLALTLLIGMGWRQWQGLQGHDRREGLFWRVIRVLSPAVVGVGGALALMGIGLLASLSRGAWLGAMAAGLALTALAGRRAALLVAGLVALALLVGAAGEVDLLPDLLRTRVSSIVENVRIFDAGNVRITPANFAIVERMAHWQAGVRMIRDYPLLGVGTGNYNQAYRTYFVDPWRASRGHAHNYYIHITAESGVLGLGAYLALLGGVGWLGAQALRRSESGFWRGVSFGVCGIMVAVAGHNAFENLHVLNMGIQLSAAWGLLALAASGGDTQTKGEDVCDF